MTPEPTIYRDETTGKCWQLEAQADLIIILRRGRLIETHEREGFSDRFTEVC